MFDKEFDEVALDNALISKARLRLGSLSQSDLLYTRIRRDFEAEKNEYLSIVDLGGSNADSIFSYDRNNVPAISAFFTKKYHNDYFKKALLSVNNLAEQDSWVLGREFDLSDMPQLVLNIQRKYFQHYVQEWDGFLNSLGFKQHSSAAGAAEAFSILSGNTSPFQILLDNVAANTDFPQGDVAGSAATFASESGDRLSRIMGSKTEIEDISLQMPSALVNMHFQSLHTFVNGSDGSSGALGGVNDLFSELYLEFDALSNGDSTGGGKTRSLMNQLKAMSARQPQPVNRWLAQVSGNTRKLSTSRSRSRIDAAWQEEVLPLCRQATAGRYPFAQKSRREVSITEFTRLFGPGGRMDRFFDTPFAAHVSRSGSNWRWKSSEGRSMGISSSVLVQFKKARDIKEMFFGDGGSQPMVRFALKPIYLDANVRSFSIDLAGQRMRYRHGPARLTKVVWPSQDDTGETRIEFETDDGKVISSASHGAWSWFRLLEQSKPLALNNTIMVARFTDQGLRSSWEIHTDALRNPFEMSALREFRCPGAM
jgi:type VI secretion system protein ImpL